MRFSSLQKIVLASGNAGKIKEIQAMLSEHPIEFRSPYLMLKKPKKQAQLLSKMRLSKPKMPRYIAIYPP